MAKNKTAMDRVRADFKVCLFLVWDHLGLPPPTPTQYEIADFLQETHRRRMVEAFRGVGKSWITSVFVLWVFLSDPNHKFLVVSASKDRADAFSTFTKRLIAELEMFNHLKPNAKLNQRDSMVSFDVGPSRPAHAPSVKSVGIFGQMTGSRANTIIADDIEVPNNSATQDMREKLEERASEFEAILVPEGERRIIYLGTPQTEESIYNKQAEKGYVVRIWPARVPRPEKYDYYAGRLAPSVEQMFHEEKHWLPTDPKRFSDMELIEREAAYGRSGFALQFMLDTSLSDAEKYPLKTSDLIITDLNNEKAPITIGFASGAQYQIKDIPNVGFTGDRWHRPMYLDEEWADYEGTVMAIDPSGRGKDETGFAIVNQLHGYLWCLKCGGLDGGYDDQTLMALARMAKEFKVRKIVIESNFGDGMFTQLFQPVLRRIHPQCGVEEVSHHRQKEIRIIDTLEPIMNRHRLVVDKQVVLDDLKVLNDVSKGPQYSLFWQMTRLTKERGALKHDDRLDALAIAVNFWVQYMNRDEREAADAYKEDLLQQELDNFMEHALGKTPDKPNWLS
nr:hypothetical protein 6 [Deltaproteobacteria bacterium]